MSEEKYVLLHRDGQYFKEQNLYLGVAILTDDINLAAHMSLEDAEKKYGCMNEKRDWKIFLVQTNVFSYPYNFEVWDRLMAAEAATLAVEGEAIERKHFKDIRELLGVTTRPMIIGGHRVPVANLPYTMSSDAGHELAKGYPFAACYWDTPGGRVFSLRSTDDGADVSAIAKIYGGGGHRNASGFKVSFAEAAMFEIGA